VEFSLLVIESIRGVKKVDSTYSKSCALVVKAVVKDLGLKFVRANGAKTKITDNYLLRKVIKVTHHLKTDKYYETNLLSKVSPSENGVTVKKVPSVKLEEKQETISDAIEFRKTQKDSRVYKEKYERMLDEHERLKDMLGIKNMLNSTGQDFVISQNANRKDLSVAVALASDWHYEEEIVPETVNMMNQFDLTIADRRINNFFSNTVKLLQKEQKDSKIETMILALLGDFVTGNIHEDNVESAQLGVGEALWAVKQRIHAGIKYILDNTNVSLVIPCHSGNHGRHTKKQRIANEMNNSLEWLMYKSLEEVWAGNKRVKFIIPNSYHSYIDVFPKTATSDGYTIRFHHGHMVKYGGGVGGLTIPMNKAIGQWNRNRTVNLDCCGHFHQYMYGGNFMVNSSLIGYSPYAISVKGAYERPSQSFFLINGKHLEPTCVSKIFLEDK
jgi:hypothetical protein